DPLERQRGAAAGETDAQHDVRIARGDRVFQRVERLSEDGRQYPCRERQRAEPRRQPPHRLEGGVVRIAAERLEPGDQGFHGRSPFRWGETVRDCFVAPLLAMTT